MLTEEALDYALNKARDFAKVNSGRTEAERQEALQITLDSLGFTDELKTSLVRWLEVHGGADSKGAVFLGVFIGLFVLEYEKA